MRIGRDPDRLVHSREDQAEVSIRCARETAQARASYLAMCQPVFVARP